MRIRTSIKTKVIVNIIHQSLLKSVEILKLDISLIWAKYRLELKNDPIGVICLTLIGLLCLILPLLMFMIKIIIRIF